MKKIVYYCKIEFEDGAKRNTSPTMTEKQARKDADEFIKYNPLLRDHHGEIAKIKTIKETRIIEEI